MRTAVPRRTRQLTPGDKLGKYEVIRQIAVGGMAELYLARTQGLQGFEKLVVLKRILPQYVTSQSFVTMFLNEARIAATLHHPNIAQVYDIDLDDGDYFFAMEYVHGQDLDHMTVAAEEQGVPLSLDAALTLVSGLCAGLHYAHDRTGVDGAPLQIVHRDVSPSNVLVSYDGAIKLVDFGIARASSRAGTTQGGLKGKIAYMSPEQCRSKAQLDRRSDIFSVGTILYELTTGHSPFTGESEYQILHQIVNEDAPPPSKIVPGYPPRLEKIVRRALERDVDRRYATALELQADIEDFAHESRLRISPLVLARLMGTLFPERLEEWDQAKTQGGVALEQHVLRTLAGKTQALDNDGDDEPRPEPAATGYELEHETFEFVSEPEPRKPTPYPVITELMSATPGALVTAAGKYRGVPTSAIGKVADPTERVRVPPPRLLRRSRLHVMVFAALAVLVIGGAIAALTLRPSAKAPHEPATPAKIEMKAEPVEVMPPVADEPPVAPPPSAAPPAEKRDAKPSLLKKGASMPRPTSGHF